MLTNNPNSSPAISDAAVETCLEDICGVMSRALTSRPADREIDPAERAAKAETLLREALAVISKHAWRHGDLREAATRLDAEVAELDEPECVDVQAILRVARELDTHATDHRDNGHRSFAGELEELSNVLTKAVGR